MNLNKSQQQMTTPPASTGAEDLILKFIWALNRLEQNTAPLVPLVQTPTLATNQMCVWAPDTFNRMNPEDLQTFLLQCQITFKSCPQDFPTESSRVFFAISYLKKVALEWFELLRTDQECYWQCTSQQRVSRCVMKWSLRGLQRVARSCLVWR